ncbi:MAG TPA: hypothetical protein VFQ50_04885 [Flavobacterium sp.]|jgi:hypothetical protein|nr:hypothetical protein [Flavobacterium sp.]
MKKLMNYACLFAGILLLQGCWGHDDESDPWAGSNYYAEIITRAELESSVQAQPQQTIVEAGKIYIKDNLMFINDVNKGFHVYNYSDPQNPVRTGFIKIPGATDLAVRDNVIFINQAVDLVTIVYDPVMNTIVSLHRNRNVFPQKISPQGYSANPNNDDVVIDWIPNS